MRDRNFLEIIAGVLFGILYVVFWVIPKTILTWIGHFIKGVFLDVHNRAIKWVGGLLFTALIVYLYATFGGHLGL